MKQSTNLFKKILCLVVITGLYGCGEEKQKTPEPKKEIEVDAPSNIISLEQADSIYGNYSKHRVSIIENYETKERVPEEKFEASRFVDFDYETIKKYIAYIDQEAKSAGVKKVTKLRLYFANYPNENTFPDGKEVKHKRQNSIFMVPTLEKNNRDYGFYIGTDGGPELIVNWKDQMKNGMGLSNFGEGKSYASFTHAFSLNPSLIVEKSLALNYGGSGPPPRGDF